MVQTLLGWAHYNICQQIAFTLDIISSEAIAS